MADDDPFGFGADDDKTRVVPRPGGRTRSGPGSKVEPGQRTGAPVDPTRIAPAQKTAAPPSAPPSAPRSMPRGQAGGLQAQFSSSSSVNPLLDVAAPLLMLLQRLRATVAHPDPAGLKDRLVGEIKAFNARAQARGLEQSPVFMAQYVLCTSLDEAVLNTPWGGNSLWQSNNLLTSFHGERSGGEKCFTLLERLHQDPAKHLNVLELMYACLSLGFEGRYRVIPDGRRQLEGVREKLFQTIRHNRAPPSEALSPQWEGVVDRQNPLVRYVPLWVVAVVGGLLLLGGFWAFSYYLNQKSDPVLHVIDAVEAPAEPARTVAGPEPRRAAPKSIPTLRELLAVEIQSGVLDVVDDGTNAVVRLRGDGLFGSGRADVKRDYQGVLARVAAALNEVPGPVLVTGHSDNVPIRTIRFPSNSHLSQARADAVRTLLAAGMRDPGRLSAKGRADLDPVADNKTAQGRKQNRRVDILVPRS